MKYWQESTELRAPKLKLYVSPSREFKGVPEPMPRALVPQGSRRSFRDPDPALERGETTGTLLPSREINV